MSPDSLARPEKVEKYSASLRRLLLLVRALLLAHVTIAGIVALLVTSIGPVEDRNVDFGGKVLSGVGREPREDQDPTV